MAAKMHGKKAAVFVVLGTLIHFGVVFAFVVDRLSCNGQAWCDTLASKVLGEILGLPFGLFSRALEFAGVDVNKLLWLRFPFGPFLLFLINSFFASLLVWFAIKALLGRRRQRVNRAE